MKAVTASILKQMDVNDIREKETEKEKPIQFNLITRQNEGLS